MCAFCNSGSILPESISRSSFINDISDFITRQLVSTQDKKYCTFINANTTKVESVLRKVIWSGGRKVMSIRIINGTIKKLGIYYTQMRHAFVFLQGIENINHIASNVLSQNIFWINNPKYYFIITRRVNLRNEEIEQALNQFWIKKHIVNSLLIYADKRGIFHVYSYNPFTKQLVNHKTNEEQSKLFPNKMKNLHGYPIRVCIFYSQLMAKIINGKCHVGLDCDVLNIFMRHLNATIKFISPGILQANTFKLSRQYVIEDKAEISFNNMFLTEDMLLYTSFAFAHLRLFAAVPRAKELTFLLNMMFAFDLYVWSLIIFLGMLFAILKYLLITSKKGAKVHNKSIKILILSRLFYLVIFCNSFQGVVITILTSPKYGKDIATIADLQESKLNVYGEIDWKPIIPKEILSQYKYLNYLEVALALRGLKCDGAYLTSEYWMDSLLRNKSSDGSRYSRYYFKMKEPLATGLLTYYTRKNSPYNKIIYHTILLIQNFGLDLKFGKGYNGFHKTRHTEKLSLKHLQGAFLLLVTGYTCSTIILIIEKLLVCMYKEKN
ncbi:hypothetical protein GWI33_007815 [Rhynchophorus ferrugineus]|uniref:Ionotropic receptor n=1 Tax=Rhynchophorus ferrugineus TaxID=354439 RepID=A0A834MBP0_RHYFE|nr:hypothetical protein GWI33_007815 [Rhynchophorus ferrugineus]